MYLEKKERNKYTIGKKFRKIKSIRRKDITGKQVPMPKQLQEYIDQLKLQGLEVKNLAFAHFQTSNGLAYPGLIATENILANTILVKVPVDSLLTTRDAFLSDIQRIFIENPKFYAKEFSSDWEDRILLTYLLYEYQKGKKSRWWNLIRNLPRDIDYAIFWSKAQIAELEDESMIEHIRKQRERFHTDSAQLIKILSIYPEFFNPSTITPQNIIWLNTHLVTRCFGKYFEYTTMVPFAELFNHECTDVYYTMFYEPGNPHTENQEFYDEKQLSASDMEECNSSDGSYDADDFEEEDQFLEWDEMCITPEEFYKTNNRQLLTEIKSMKIHMFSFINFSDSISYHYLEKILQEIRKLSTVQPQKIKERSEKIHQCNVKYIKRIKQLYHKLNCKYYRYGVRQKRSKPEKKSLQGPLKNGEEYFQKQWKKDKFDKFYMLCSTKDQFEKGSQVFFCYGRLPNKLLLMRYGIALQYNKYDHMYIKINIEKYLLGNMNFRSLLEDIKIKKYRRFKVKRTKLCLEIIVHCRVQKWEYEDKVESIFTVMDATKQIQVLLEVKYFFIEEMKKYQFDLGKNQARLKDKSLGYHQYFALVYKVQRQRMLNDQIKMLQYAIEVVDQIKKGKSLEEVLKSETKQERITFQIMMEEYWKTFLIGK